MISADNLAKEWVQIALSKPTVIHEVETKWKRYQISRTEDYKYAFETVF